MDANKARRSILLVDDIELFLELERTFFHRDAFDLLMAITAQEVKQLVLWRQPSLIFLDMHIAGARAEDICRWVKKDQALDIPIVMVVDAGDDKAEFRCREAGCNAILQRPVRRQQLLTVARQFLGLVDRKQARTPARLAVSFGTSAMQLQTACAFNLGLGGIFIATHLDLPIGSSLVLQLHLPEQGGVLDCCGRVAWRNHPAAVKRPHLPTGLGIEFTNLHEGQLGVVRHYLNGEAA